MQHILSIVCTALHKQEFGQPLKQQFADRTAPISDGEAARIWERECLLVCALHGLKLCAARGTSHLGHPASVHYELGTRRDNTVIRNALLRANGKWERLGLMMAGMDQGLKRAEKLMLGHLPAADHAVAGCGGLGPRTRTSIGADDTRMMRGQAMEMVSRPFVSI